MKVFMLAVAMLLIGPGRAVADDELRVGLYAPTAPFGGTSARVDYITRLASHLGDAAGVESSAKVYARAGDFAAAIKKGEIDVAVVDATYLASIGTPYTVLATATRDGDDASTWQLVSRGGEDAILDLKDKTVLCPAIGGREADFVDNVLLGGELPRGFFKKVSSSPDTVSALAALDLGRADAAMVPSGVDLPTGVARVASLPSIRWPVLVAFSGVADDLRKTVAKAATKFSGGDILGGFQSGGGDAVRSLGRRFSRTERRGPMVQPNLRVTVDELVEARKPAIPRLAIESLVAAPPPLPPPGTAP